MATTSKEGIWPANYPILTRGGSVKKNNNKGLLHGPVIRMSSAPGSKATNGYSKP